MGSTDPHVTGDGAILLRHASGVEHSDLLALEMRRHAEDCTDRDDAGAAHASDDNAVRIAAIRDRGHRQTRCRILVALPLCLADVPAGDGHEARAKSLETGKVL